jgi:LemA protein
VIHATKPRHLSISSVWNERCPIVWSVTIMLFWVVLFIVVATGLYTIVIYNRLVRSRQMANEAWSGIDVQLKRRSSLVPNLVECVKGYAAHERGLFQQVTELRLAARVLPSEDVGRRALVEGALSLALNSLIALAENYPDLKASDNFLELQQELSRLEAEIQMARRYYNGAVRNLNTLVESFPNNMVARLLGYSQREYFEPLAETDRAVPEIVL